MDLTKALALWRGRTGGRRVAVLTFNGAAGVVAADHLSKQDMTIAVLSRGTLQRLRSIYPPWLKPENPIDIWPAIERSGRQESYEIALDALVNDPEVDAIHIHLYLDSQSMKGGVV